MGIVEDPNANAVCLRKVAQTLENSVEASFRWAIAKLDWEHLFKCISGRITYLPTGQVILMEGLDDPLKLKSIRATKGYFKYLWFEEGAEYSSLEEIESVEQSVLRGGQKFIEFITYNPPVEPRHWINEAAREDRPSRLVHESNYKQVPPEWLGPKFLSDAAEMARNKPDKYAHVYMGKEIGRSDSIVFSGSYIVTDFDVEARTGINGLKQNYISDDEVEGPYFGADWGFAQDPTTLVKCWYSPKRGRIYIEHEAGGKPKLDAIPSLFEKVPDSRRYKIRADCSRPETIVHVKDRGFNIEAAEKWPGSVEDGIEWLKGNEIVIHTRCTETQDEAIKYSYKIDRVTKDVLPDLVDKHNHYWDAVRYAFAPMIKPKPKGIFSSGLLG